MTEKSSPKTIAINGISGALYKADGHHHLSESRKPVAVFVPNALIKEGLLNRTGYAAGFWHEINTAANPHAHGSHLWPDLQRPWDSKTLPPTVRRKVLGYLSKVMPQG